MFMKVMGDKSSIFATTHYAFVWDGMIKSEWEMGSNSGWMKSRQKRKSLSYSTFALGVIIDATTTIPVEIGKAYRLLLQADINHETLDLKYSW